jgi:L-iditol 2-dehydrogenase
MKAVILKKPGDFGPGIVDDSRPGEGELLLRVKACSLCGTDIRVLEGKKTKGVRYPSIIGHEFAGIVEEAGRGVTIVRLQVRALPGEAARRKAFF